MANNDHHKINYIEFSAADLPAIKKFYGEVFGWQFTDYGHEYTAFTDGNLEGGFAKGTLTGRDPLVILYSNDLEETVNAVLKHGGKIAKDIFPFPGGRRFHFTDPHGNELAVWSAV
jgi:predicted enzyme related to lactoylglutathione lyase